MNEPKKAQSKAQARQTLAPTAGYVVAGGGTLEVGKEYVCKNQRKGEFKMRITELRGEWVEGVITSGVANAALADNVREEGEEVTVRDCHSFFIPVTPTT